MTLPYKPLTWGDDEALFNDKLNQMTNNDQWLFENMPRARYSANVTKESGIKILATRAVVGARSQASGGAAIYFGNTFSSSCAPIVIASVSATNSQRRFFVNVNGLGKNAYPDHNGCVVYIVASELNPKANKIAGNVYVNIIAVGW